MRAFLTGADTRQYAGLSAADGIALLEGQQQRHPEALQEPIKESLLLTATQQAGEQLARGLKELIYSVALQVALADGPVSPVEQAELALLLDAAGTTAQRADTNPCVGEANGDATTAPPAEVAPFRPEPQVQPGVVTLDILKEKTKELVESLEPLLKVELRRIRQASNARIIVEQDIRAVIIRAGWSNGSVSEYAAHVYLEIFKILHPRQFAQWNTQDAREVLQGIVEKDRDTYLGNPKKPFTLEALERLDAAHGTSVTKSARDVLLIIAVFAASVEGIVSDEKQAEISELNAVFEAA